MSSYDNVYDKRLNQHGINHQSRIQGEAEKQFEVYLNRSAFRVEFSYNNETVVGSFERMNRDQSKCLHYLLVRTNQLFDGGTILTIPNLNGSNEQWMVYYKDDIHASGYNRYIMIKMNYYLTWQGLDKLSHSSWAFLHGKSESALLKDAMLSRMPAYYSENDNASYLIMPKNAFMRREIYFEINQNTDYHEAFSVTGYDWNSVAGVMFVTVDPVLIRDHSPIPQPAPGESQDAYYWFTNGGSN